MWVKIYMHIRIWFRIPTASYIDRVTILSFLPTTLDTANVTALWRCLGINQTNEGEQGLLSK